MHVTQVVDLCHLTGDPEGILRIACRFRTLSAGRFNTYTRSTNQLSSAGVHFLGWLNHRCDLNQQVTTPRVLQTKGETLASWDQDPLG
jgi:hypothetical protein